MAKQSRKHLRRAIIRKSGSRNSADRHDMDDTVVELNSFSAHSKRSGFRERQFSISARNQSQGQYMAAIRSNALTFGLGPAGTGKTFCATAMAVEAFEERSLEKIIFTRPAVEAGESLGYLPGKIHDKLEPYFSTFRNYLNDMLGRGVVDCALKNDRIVFEPLAYIRGKTFDNAFVILDEAQNCTRLQIKALLTRIGENARVVVNGDTRQSDIGNGSGLVDAALRLQGLRDVYIHEFENKDIVRSELVRNIIERYESG